MTDNKELKYNDPLTDNDDGVLSYAGKDIGFWSDEHDSKLGSYRFITLDDGSNFHDHHHSEEEIIKSILKQYPDLK
jgi:hypothetical protein